MLISTVKKHLTHEISQRKFGRVKGALKNQDEKQIPVKQLMGLLKRKLNQFCINRYIKVCNSFR